MRNTGKIKPISAWQEELMSNIFAKTSVLEISMELITKSSEDRRLILKNGLYRSLNRDYI